MTDLDGRIKSTQKSQPSEFHFEFKIASTGMLMASNVVCFYINFVFFLFNK